jgi:hypothetical protein
MVGSVIDSSESSSILPCVISNFNSVHRTDTYGDLVHYFKYASSTYVLVCPRPNGNTLVLNVSGVPAQDDFTDPA